MPYLPGKLPNPVLASLLATLRARPDPRVLVGPRVGEDAAVLDFGAQALVVATDPITFAADQPGWYAVQVNANDVATRGARPRWFLAVALLPEKGTDERLVTTLFEQVTSACAALDCALIGGHTEITLGLDRPIIVGQMLGEVSRDRLVTTGGAQAGDALLLSKAIAIEGTCLLARERADRLANAGLGEDQLARGRRLLYDPGISIVREALAASEATRVHAMHDPTEGGLATGIAEMALASNLGVRLDGAAIPVLPECAAICNALRLDPLGLLASGSLLIAVARGDVAAVTQAITEAGIACAQIGEFVAREEGLTMRAGGAWVALPEFARDEIARTLG